MNLTGDLIKVQNGVATREPVPGFLAALQSESLADLSWTTPGEGVQECAWWPAVDETPEINHLQKYGPEILTVDTEEKVVRVSREIWDKTEHEVAAYLEPIWEQIKELRTHHDLTGGYKVGNYWFHSDGLSRDRLQGLVQAAMLVQFSGGDMDVPFASPSEADGLTYKTMSGERVPMTPKVALAILQASFVHEGARHQHAETLWQAVLDAEEPHSVDLSAGWPERYVGGEAQ